MYTCIYRCQDEILIRTNVSDEKTLKMGMGATKHNIEADSRTDGGRMGWRTAHGRWTMGGQRTANAGRRADRPRMADGGRPPDGGRRADGQRTAGGWTTDGGRTAAGGRQPQGGWTADSGRTDSGWRPDGWQTAGGWMENWLRNLTSSAVALDDVVSQGCGRDRP